MFNWFRQSQGLIYGAMVFLLCYVSLFVFSLRPPLVFDSFWHLQMGKDFLENGLSPWIDHYSYTYFGQNISSVPVIFQLLLAAVVAIFGDNYGFVFFKQFYVILLLSFIYLYFKQIKASWFIVFLILPFLIYFIQMRLIIRPEILSNILIIICLSLYLKARASFGSKELASISILLLFWVNYHTPVFGYVIIFGLFLDRAIGKIINRDEPYTWYQWFFWGIIIFVIGFINPTFQHFFISMISSTEDWSSYITEYQPSINVYSTNKLIFLLWGLSLYLMIWALIKRQFGFAFITIFLGYFSYTMARLITPVAIINFCILAFFLSQISLKQISLIKINSVLKLMLILAAVSLPLMAYYYAVRDARFVLQTMDNNINKRYPVQIVDYLKNYQKGGNILNSLTMGGYLINKLSPDYKVHIDGRTNILYSLDYYKHHRKVYTDSKVLNNEVKKYNIEYILYKTSPDALFFEKHIKNLSLNFADDGYLLFADNKKIAFPVSSKLSVFPMCWDDRLNRAIKKEIDLSDKIFADKSYTIKLMLSSLKDYISQSDKPMFFEMLKSNIPPSDITLRLTGYLALKHQDFASALSLFGSIKEMQNYDILMFAYSMVKARQDKDVESVLLTFLAKKRSSKKNKLLAFDLAVLIEILEIYKKNNEFQLFTSDEVNAFKNEIKKVNFNNNLPLTSFIPYHNQCNTIFHTDLK